ncbi:hypothetical protein [Spirosoma foliorum]|uniref:Uncharacterized protein n=1 Tax=Spirosoma foliorum TaxID=2710596 RepID=A0A7G5H5G9_9BACT|nr:hypothetical protein [Spirosoma foliorum]QMW06361.1 hypothetical protein H3H32_16455 [Spirosoma foliorum]
MPQLLRIQLYDGPSRQTYSLLQADIVVENPPHYSYGQPLLIGDDADDPATWPTYVVAHFPHILQEPDPDRPGKKRIVYEVFVARESEWGGFGLPEGLGEV